MPGKYCNTSAITWRQCEDYAVSTFQAGRVFFLLFILIVKVQRSLRRAFNGHFRSQFLFRFHWFFTDVLIMSQNCYGRAFYLVTGLCANSFMFFNCIQNIPSLIKFLFNLNEIYLARIINNFLSILFVSKLIIIDGAACSFL